MTKQQKVFVLFGNAGAGKDTVGKMISDYYRGVLDIGDGKSIVHDSKTNNAVITCFAAALKTAAWHLVGIPEAVSYGTQEDKAKTFYYGKSARHWLQWIGTEVGRNGIHPDVWVERTASFIRQQRHPEAVIVTDGRFENELKLPLLLANHDVYNIIISREGLEVDLSHPSERSPYDLLMRHRSGERLFHFHIGNDGTLVTLRESVRGILERLP